MLINKMSKKTKINIDLLHSPKGTRDLLSEDYELQKEISEKAEKIAAYYGFSPIETPHIEKEELFTATLGETSDIVEKQMYTIRTKGGDRLVLRPEYTAPVMRAYLEHGMHTLPQPVMLYYNGALFRHENPQKGRLREYHSFGLEILGAQDEIADALILRLTTLILKEIGVKSYIVNINSIGDKECAPLYKKELVSFLRKKSGNLCSDCKRRLKTNPLRVLDCKEEKCKEIVSNAPQMIDFLCDDCKKHFKTVLEYLDELNIPYILDNCLVRGLDYYSRTVFEIFEETAEEENTPKNDIEEKESKIALAAGGRYDYLGQIISGKNVPGVGAGIGIERLALILKEQTGATKEKRKQKTPKIYLIQLGELAKRKSLLLLEDLRKAHIPILHSLSKDSLRGQLKSADNLKSEIALIIGQKEALENTVIARNMETGSQEIIEISKAAEYLKEKI